MLQENYKILLIVYSRIVLSVLFRNIKIIE